MRGSLEAASRRFADDFNRELGRVMGTFPPPPPDRDAAMALAHHYDEWISQDGDPHLIAAVYAILFLVPDLSFLGYLAGPQAGAVVYNAAHSYLAPMTLMVAGFSMASPLVLSIAMIWLAHIGIDRALGYGLKYKTGFGFTHLGRIGKDAAKA